MDELHLANEIGDQDKQLGQDIIGWADWKKVYLWWPKRLGGKWYWRRHVWRRKTMAKHFDYVYAVIKPRLHGHSYMIWENVHDDHLEQKHIKKGVLKVKK